MGSYEHKECSACNAEGHPAMIFEAVDEATTQCRECGAVNGVVNTYYQAIHIPRQELEEMENILSITEGHHPEYGSDEVIKTYTAHFPNGMVADIKVCNGDTPYVDNVLFEPTIENGTTYLVEVCVPEIAESLEGEYYFNHEGIEYVVDVKPLPCQ